MAQIIKHRRGSIGSLKSTTARNAELIIASGSISDLSGPFVFIGSPNSGDEGIAGAFNTVSKLYTGTNAPTITAATYGSGLDGTPYYASGDKSLYILNNSNVGNTKIDLTGNIEGNTISGVTINALTASFVSASNTVSAATGSFGQINVSNIAFTGLTEGRVSLVGPGGSIVDSGSLNFNNGELGISGSIKLNTDAYIYNDGALYVEDHTNGVQVQSNNFVDLQSNNNFVYLESGYTEIYSEGNTDIYGEQAINIYSQNGDVAISSYSGHTLYLNNDGGEGNINLGNYVNNVYGYTTITNLIGSNYAQLESSGSFVWVEAIGAHLQNDSGSAGVGFTARPNGIIEATGSLYVYGDTQISGNTSVTGTFVVSDGAAFINQGVVSQNSNVLLTSGSSLIVQNNGSAWVDYIRGNTQEWNYLALNSNGVFSPSGVELASSGNISLWAEGGTVNVTGSMRVTGDITFSGSINLGDYTGDTVNFTGEVNSNILPTTGNTYSLGSSGQTWSDIWAENAHFDNISLNSISFSGLTEGRTVFVGGDGSLVDFSGYTFNSGSGYLVAPIIHATDDGNGTNFLIGNDMWLGDVNEQNTTRFAGYEDSNVAKIYLGNSNSNNYLHANYGNVSLNSNDALYLASSNGGVNINSYDGSVNINDDSNNSVNIGGHTYIQNRNLYVDRIWDYSDNVNYLELYGWNTDDGYWWESGNGNDTTLLNNVNNNNLNILQTNNGDVNIDATGGSVNLHTQNGFNVTGSMIVSDASGVFNSSLIVSNSDLTLDGGTNQHMNDGAHLYFDTCVDMYYDASTDNFIFYNDCNSFQFRNDVSITGSINVSNGINTDNIYGVTTSFNALHLNGGTYNAPDVELTSYGDISLFSEGNRGHTSTINMTGSVHITGDLDVTGSVYAGGMFNYNNSINNGGIYIDSGNYSEISYNDEQVYLGVDASGIWGTSNSGTTIFTSNAGDTTINANNGYNVNVNANNILLNGDTAVTGTLSVSSDIMTDGNLYVSGNLEVLGSSTNVHLESHTVNIGDNIILVNAYSPFQRYAGLAAFDSGSLGASGSVSGSLLWDSLSDYWMFVSASGQSSKLIGTTAGTYGSENSLTSGTIPIATGDNNIGDSLLTYSGTTLAYNTNKFTIDSGTGETYINGNVTLNSGASDLGLKTSGIVFRNDDDVLGFVSTTETTDVMDGVLGYRSSDGVLVFSTVIDGGSY